MDAIAVLVPAAPNEWTCRSAVEPTGLVTQLVSRGDGSHDAQQVHWALLADPHIAASAEQSYSGHYPARNVEAAVAEVLKAGPQAALINGDLAWDQGLPDDYSRLRKMLGPLSARIPLCLMPGNHDNRRGLLAEFLGDPETAIAAAKSIVVVEHGPVRWVLLDSLFRTDVVPGLLGKAQRDWLRQVLETSDDRPTLIAVHHPLDEEDGSLLDGERLLQIVQPVGKVKAVFTAHDHAYRIESRDGMHVISLPALGMPFFEDEPLGWVEVSLSDGQGVFTFHAVGENRAGDGMTRTLAWR